MMKRMPYMGKRECEDFLKMAIKDKEIENGQSTSCSLGFSLAWIPSSQRWAKPISMPFRRQQIPLRATLPFKFLNRTNGVLNSLSKCLLQLSCSLLTKILRIQSNLRMNLLLRTDARSKPESLYHDHIQRQWTIQSTAANGEKLSTSSCETT